MTMEKIIIGRGGCQAEKIENPEVGACHCSVTDHGNDTYMVNPVNHRATMLNGERIFETTTCESVDTIRLGDNFEIKVKDAFVPYDVKEIKDWGVAANRFERAIDAEVFRRVCLPLYELDEEEEKFLECNLKACQAYWLIGEGKLRAAQILIYEAGDVLFAMQDDSAPLKNAYAAVMALVAYLYEKASLSDLANTARQRLSQLESNGAKGSQFVNDLK